MGTRTDSICVKTMADNPVRGSSGSSGLMGPFFVGGGGEMYDAASAAAAAVASFEMESGIRQQQQQQQHMEQQQKVGMICIPNQYCKATLISVACSMYIFV